MIFGTGFIIAKNPLHGTPCHLVWDEIHRFKFIYKPGLERTRNRGPSVLFVTKVALLLKHAY